MTGEIEAEVLNFIIDRLQIEDEWFDGRGRGFTWWAGALAQRVSFSAPRDLHGVRAVTLHVETDLLAGVSATGATWQRLAAMNRLATLSAYVADVAAATVCLHASVTLTEANWPLARVLAVHAAALQVADAHAEAAELARIFGARVHATGHPSRGARPHPDEMLGVIEVYQQRGQEPSPFTTEALANLVHLEPRPWVMAANEPDRLVADLTFAAGQPARLELDASVVHPALGSGLQLRLLIPVEPDAAIAQRLNANEAVQPDAHQLGAWCVDEERGLGFATFVPAATHNPELMRALVYHSAGRNEWARALLFPQ
ncbi:MAG TPA: hypothetical protein PLH72_17270 [Vicinamibacterales bacterium]|nr:hypothetical protein [Vicinamibacterales bacterium]